MNRHHAPTAPSGFASPEHSPGPLDAASAAAILGAVGDIALVLDGEGRVLDMAVSDAELVRLGIGGWGGRRWAETVMPEGVPKITEMLAEAKGQGAPRWRQLTHPTPNGDVPAKYLVMRLGDSGRLIAIGRELRGAAETQQRLIQTQQSLERDYLRMRQAEARYRLLFDMAHEPVLIVDAATRRIREANSAAHRLLGLKDGALSDQPTSTIADLEDRERLIAFLGAAEAGATLQPLSIRLRKGAGSARISATLFRQARMALLLIRIDADEAPAVETSGDERLRAVIDQMPDAFVLTDEAMTVLAANPAFVDLAEMAGMEQVLGRRIGDWLGRPGIDAELIQRQLREHDLVRNVASILRGAHGSEEDVEVSAVRVDGDGSTHFGFAIRPVARRLRDVPVIAPHGPRSVEQLTDLVGRMPLKEIVRESTDLIERLCIEAALTYTDDNRASAAEMLGLSRQSLYSKLHRHGLGSLTGEGSISGDN